MDGQGCPIFGGVVNRALALGAFTTNNPDIDKPNALGGNVFGGFFAGFGGCHGNDAGLVIIDNQNISSGITMIGGQNTRRFRDGLAISQHHREVFIGFVVGIVDNGDGDRLHNLTGRKRQLVADCHVVLT
eukprot:Lithocolla_globosa_v1_NODE_1276_length_2703_cov_31.340883.p3 type:complete len:130 gc:universal NODE_1276_length_2703_cov_31.340883:1682-1293(-)